MTQRQWLADDPPLTKPEHPAPDAAARQNSSEPAPAEETPPPSLPPGSLRAKAFVAIERLGKKLQLNAAIGRAEPSRMCVELADSNGLGISLLVEAARADGQYYDRTGTLGVWYQRHEDHSGDDPRWITPLLKVTTKLLSSPILDGMADEFPEHTVAPPSKSPSTGPATDTEASVGTSTSPEIPLQINAEAIDVEPPADPAKPYARPYILGPDDVERFFHVDYEYEEDADVHQPPTCRIGIIYQCNQWCTFCQLAEMNTHIPPARIYAGLDASRERGAERVIFTGGEPTMCGHLVDYVRYARANGFSTVELQTNATLLDRPERAVELRDAGLTHAQVSLHGPDAEVSDRLTAAPGTHDRTLDGITNLLDVGVRVLLNHLIFRDNASLLSEYLDMVERLWGHHKSNLILQFHSPLNEFARVEHARQHIARYSEYAPQLCQTIERARELGYFAQDLQDPTGIPALCVVGLDQSALGQIASQRIKPRFHRWESEWVARVEACNDCDVAEFCMGIPKAYLALHGDEEFHSVHLTDES